MCVYIYTYTVLLTNVPYIHLYVYMYGMYMLLILMEILIITSLAVPSQPFINVNLVAMTTRTIDTAIGSGCTTMESNAAITYVFQYKETTSEVWKGIETSNSSVTIPSLKAATTYDIRAYCYNSVGKSALSNKISEKTLSESSKC